MKKLMSLFLILAVLFIGCNFEADSDYVNPTPTDVVEETGDDTGTEVTEDPADQGDDELPEDPDNTEDETDPSDNTDTTEDDEVVDDELDNPTPDNGDDLDNTDDPQDPINDEPEEVIVEPTPEVPASDLILTREEIEAHNAKGTWTESYTNINNIYTPIVPDTTKAIKSYLADFSGVIHFQSATVASVKEDVVCISGENNDVLTIIESTENPELNGNTYYFCGMEFKYDTVGTGSMYEIFADPNCTCTIDAFYKDVAGNEYLIKFKKVFHYGYYSIIYAIFNDTTEVFTEFSKATKSTSLLHKAAGYSINGWKTDLSSLVDPTEFDVIVEIDNSTIIERNISWLGVYKSKRTGDYVVVSRDYSNLIECYTYDTIDTCTESDGVKLRNSTTDYICTIKLFGGTASTTHIRQQIRFYSSNTTKSSSNYHISVVDMDKYLCEYFN